MKLSKAERMEEGDSDNMDVKANPLSTSFLMKVRLQAYVQGRTASQVFIPIPTINEHPSSSVENVKKLPCTPHFVVVVGKHLHLSCQLPEG